MHDRIQHYFHTRLAAEREPIAAGAFTLYRHPTEDHPFLNYAIPNLTHPPAEPDDGSALVAAARKRGLIPRIESVQPCAPWVRDLPGFTVEDELRLMASEAPVALRSEAQIEVVRKGSPHVAGLMRAQMAAFEESPPSDEQIARWDGRAVAALVDGEVVGAAAWTQVFDGMTEIAGIAVIEAYRRRGIAGALTAEATRQGFLEGASLAVLVPGHEGAARVYERAGFADASRMIHVRTNA
jgi:ribosomal protein S18 acetylase RimI-like enzyme